MVSPGEILGVLLINAPIAKGADAPIFIDKIAF
jgi:hypothetical protein